MEALTMDPQVRVLLEEIASVMADVESKIGSLTDTKTGVYIGCMYQEFVQLAIACGMKVTPGLGTGNGISFMVGRVSYTFGLQV
jgi:acyl transferase domain-containing protein